MTDQKGGGRMTDEIPTQIDELATLAPDDAEAVAAAAQAEQDATGEHVVGFGCAVADRVFLAAVSGSRNMPYTLPIPHCPGCGESHEVKAMPRPRKISDEIAITVEPPDTPEEAGKRRATPKSDAEVIGAIPDDWTPVTEVAEKLGYANRLSLINRLREMHERGAGIETRREPRSAPMFVRRAGIQ
jgi:hypothetical protein